MEIVNVGRVSVPLLVARGAFRATEPELPYPWWRYGKQSNSMRQ